MYHTSEIELTLVQSVARSLGKKAGEWHEERCSYGLGGDGNHLPDCQCVISPVITPAMLVSSSGELKTHKAGGD